MAKEKEEQYLLLEWEDYKVIENFDHNPTEEELVHYCCENIRTRYLVVKVVKDFIIKGVITKC